MELFDYPVMDQPSIQARFRTLRADFGDGYTQEAGDGINTRKESWQVSVTGRWADDGGMPVKAVSEFLDRHAGYKAFQWVTPLGDLKLFKCRGGYSKKQESPGVYTVTATFEEVYQP